MAGQGKKRMTRKEIETQDQSRVQRPEKASEAICSDLPDHYTLALSPLKSASALTSIPPPGDALQAAQQYESIHYIVETR